jgi:hypothetical protein
MEKRVPSCYSADAVTNLPFPRPCGAAGNDAQKLHAPAFAHFCGAVFMHEVLYLKSLAKWKES